jgi:hypothetical protein
MRYFKYWQMNLTILQAIKLILALSILVFLNLKLKFRQNRFKFVKKRGKEKVDELG